MRGWKGKKLCREIVKDVAKALVEALCFNLMFSLSRKQHLFSFGKTPEFSVWLAKAGSTPSHCRKQGYRPGHL